MDKINPIKLLKDNHKSVAKIREYMDILDKTVKLANLPSYLMKDYALFKKLIEDEMANCDQNSASLYLYLGRENNGSH